MEAGDEEWYGKHTLSSQLGSLVVIADRRCLEGKDGRFSIVDWKSRSSHRVCRSTFAGETMACSEAIETSIYLRSLLLSFQLGKQVDAEEAGLHMPLHLITDCKSLYDHIHREGVPRAPSEKRLAIDLAGIRQVLLLEGRHQWHQRHGTGEPAPERPLRPPLHWLPTGDQMADLLTKRLKPEEWWQTVKRATLNFPLREGVRRAFEKSEN